MVKKIRLNDAQWNRLQQLAKEESVRCMSPELAPRSSSRLRSNGLVALDAQGREYLTEQGARRLTQGR